MLPVVDIRKFIGRQCRLKGKPLVQVKCSFEYREVIIRIGCHKDKRLADSPALENTIRRKMTEEFNKVLVLVFLNRCLLYTSQEYVIENHDQYPKKMCFDIFGADKIEQFNIQMGEELTVSFDIDARQWQDRWFNSIRAWKVERVGAGAPMAPGAPVPPPAPSSAPEFIAGDAKDDLPF